MIWDLWGEVTVENEIEELYNEGYSVQDIARELNVGKGEIELMLGITERYLKLAN